MAAGWTHLEDDLPDPRSWPVAIDANALERKDQGRSDLVDRFLRLVGAGRLNLFVSESVRRELIRPKTEAAARTGSEGGAPAGEAEQTSYRADRSLAEGQEAAVSCPGATSAGPHGDKARRAARPLTAAEHINRIRVRSILCGNARPGKHDADAAHVSSAMEAGCAYFVTHDSRILRRRNDLHAVTHPPGFRVMVLAEFLDLFDEYERSRPP